MVGETYVGRRSSTTVVRRTPNVKKLSARERPCKRCGHIQGHHAHGSIGDHRQHSCKEPGCNCQQFVAA